MKKFIFVTPEGLTFKPNCDSPEPDYLDIQIYGFDENFTVQEAMQNLIELGEHIREYQTDQPFSVRIQNSSRKNLWVREKKIEIGMAG